MSGIIRGVSDQIIRSVHNQNKISLYATKHAQGDSVSLYEYKALVTSVYDGDSIRINWSLGAGVILENQPMRLFGIDAPEVEGVTKYDGQRARDALRTMIVGKVVEMQTIKPSKVTTGLPAAELKDKYGRWLAQIYYDGISVNDWLVENGFATSYVP